MTDSGRGRGEREGRVGASRAAGEDKQARDPSRSVKKYYSEHLIRAIKAAAIEFDAMSLR